MPSVRLFSLALATIGLLIVPRDAYSWGSGHDDIMRAVIERLPAALRESFTPEIVKEAVQHSSHYPDSFDPFLPEEIGEPGVAKLAAAGMKVRYDLHSERGMAMAFVMLVEALREKNPAHTAHWIATLSHVIADMAACNHDPIVHTATYGWGDWNLKLPGGAGFSSLKSHLDLSGPARDPAGGSAAYQSAIESQRIYDDQRDAAKALIEVMLYGQEGAAYCSGRGVGILEGASGWVDRHDEAAREKLWKNMGELGAWAVVRTLRDVEVATRFAASTVKLEITPEIEAAYEEGVARILRDRDLADEALFAPILHDLMPDQAPAIGIVLEPSWAMNGAMFGFSSRVLSVAIARTLKESGKSYATLDVRQVLSEGFPPPGRMRQLVLVASSFRGYHTLNSEVFDQKLSDYLGQGGSVLWIMGNSQPAPKSLAAFRKSMSRRDPKSLLPVTNEQFIGAGVGFVGSDLPAQKIVRSAQTAAGWQQPFCAWTYDLAGNEALDPLVTLKSGAGLLTVGAISRDRKLACMPIYAITPHLFAGSDTIASPHEPALDDACREVLFAVLAKIKP